MIESELRKKVKAVKKRSETPYVRAANSTCSFICVCGHVCMDLYAQGPDEYLHKHADVSMQYLQPPSP